MVRARAALVACLLSLPALGQATDAGTSALPDAGVAPGPRMTATTVSSNQAFAIRFEEEAPKKCRVVGLKETQQVWQLPRCVATVDDIFFISNDGERFWVLRTLPQKPLEGKKTVKNPRWWYTVVAEEFDKTGRRVRQRRLSDLLEPYDRAKVIQLGRHFKWVEGVVGLKGRSPRVNEANEVQFQVVGGKAITLKF